MFKQWYNRYKTLIISTIILGVISLVAIFILCAKILPPWNGMVILFVLYLVIAALAFFGPIVFVGLTTYLISLAYDEYKRKMDYLKASEKIQSLPNEFSKVTLIDSNCIPRKNVHCVAKLDEDGKIIYRIQFYVEASTDDYPFFLKHFEIN